MSFVLILLVILVFYWYYKTWAKSAFLNGAGRKTKSFAQGFMRGVMEERLDEFKRRMNYYVIALLAKIAKSDGRVSEQEASMISELLNANAKDAKEREFLKASFNEHKENLSDVSLVAGEFLKEVPLPQNERLNVLRVLVFMALLEGELHTKKREILEHITRIFGFSVEVLDEYVAQLGTLKRSQNTMNLREAYEILELKEGTDLTTLKKQYRTLAKKYHPDILNANKVSEEKLKQGVEKFQKINEAYELVKKHLER